jgi:hypothetical protein
VTHRTFMSAAALTNLIDTYFKYIEGEFYLEEKPGKTDGAPATMVKVFNREAESPTLAGLALYLGFNSREDFDYYENKGKFANVLKRGRLRIETEYEKKLHQQSSAGAIFALKSMGWNEREDSKLNTEDIPKSIAIKILESGPAPAGSEQEVTL